MTDRAIVIGAGPNGLAAAVTLARAGVPVEVYERASFLGGGTRTAEITLPGFRHDICSAAAGLGRDGGAWLSLMRPFVEHAERVADLISGPLLRLPARPWELLGLGLAVLEQGSPLWNLRWRDEAAPTLWLTTPAPTVPPSSPASRWRPSPTSHPRVPSSSTPLPAPWSASPVTGCPSPTSGDCSASGTATPPRRWTTRWPGPCRGQPRGWPRRARSTWVARARRWRRPRRPVLAADRWQAPGGSGMYLCSASTPPGPGVHGVSGWRAAISALRHEYGITREPYLGPRRE